jgi:hypothetical protein
VPLYSPLLKLTEFLFKVWCLGNIAGDNHEARDVCLVQPELCSRLRELFPQEKLSLKRNLVWLVSNLCRGHPSPPGHLVFPFISFLAQELTDSTDEEVGCIYVTN